jgi:hypothetical protein
MEIMLWLLILGGFAMTGLFLIVSTGGTYNRPRNPTTPAPGREHLDPYWRRQQVLGAIEEQFHVCEANDDGWCDWQSPIMDAYKMKCCDCKLVHQVEFRIVKQFDGVHGGEWEAAVVNDPSYRVQMRMKRA